MKAFIFRSAVKSVRYEVFETIINIYCRFICLCSDEFIVFILDVHGTFRGHSKRPTCTAGKFANMCRQQSTLVTGLTACVAAIGI